MKTNLEQRAVSLNVEDFIFAGRGAAGRGRRRSRTASARPSSEQAPRLRAGAHGPDERVLGRRPQHPRSHRLRGQRVRPVPADAGTRSSRCCTRRPRRRPPAEAAEAEGKPAPSPQARGPGAGLRGGQLGHRHRRPVRDAARRPSTRSTPDSKKVKGLVEIFGRETPVELTSTRSRRTSSSIFPKEPLTSGFPLGRGSLACWGPSWGRGPPSSSLR